MPYGLTDIELQKLLDVFVKNERIDQVILYGSRAKGNFKPFSDVDITLVGSELSRDDLNKVIQEIDDLLLPYQFDVSLKHKLKNEALIDHIERKGIEIYKKESIGEWKEYKLGEIATFRTERLSSSIVSIENYISTENMIPNKGGILKANRKPENELVTKYYCGDILVSNIRPYFKKIWLTNKEGGCSNDVLCITPKTNELNNKFLFYLLSQNEFFEYVMLGSKGCKMPRGDKSHIMNYRVILPSQEEQKRIASILSSLDDKIDLLHQENKTLEAMAETLFRKWFIEDAKEDWEDGIIADLIDFNPHRKLSKGNKSPFLEMSNLNTSTYCPITWRDREFMSGTKFINGDALLARITPCLENGKTAYVDFLEEGQVGWGSTEFIVMRAKRGLHPFFSYIIAKYQDFRDFAESCMAGSSGRQRVDINNLMNYEIKIPEKKVIDVFNHSINYMVTKMHNNNDEIYSLTQIRNILSFKLMNNE